MEIIQLDDYRPTEPEVKSQYELYPLPFFNREKGCTWDVTPTGDYTTDCETGEAFAIQFLKSCDKTNGWASLLGPIVTDMIRAGPKRSGVVIGFMSVIGRALVHSRVLDR